MGLDDARGGARATGRLLVARSVQSFWEEVGGGPLQLAVGEGRVLVSTGERALECERSGEMLSDLPVREYVVPGGVGDVLCLPARRLIVAEYGTGILHVMGSDDAKPFPAGDEPSRPHRDAIHRAPHHGPARGPF